MLSSPRNASSQTWVKEGSGKDFWMGHEQMKDLELLTVSAKQVDPSRRTSMLSASRTRSPFVRLSTLPPASKPQQRGAANLPGHGPALAHAVKGLQIKSSALSFNRSMRSGYRGLAEIDDDGYSA